MRAKFECCSVTRLKDTVEASLTAVSGEDKADQEFNKYTPSGTLTIMIDNKAVFNFFEPGKKYFLDISEEG